MWGGVLGWRACLLPLWNVNQSPHRPSGHFRIWKRIGESKTTKYNMQISKLYSCYYWSRIKYFLLLHGFMLDLLRIYMMHKLIITKLCCESYSYTTLRVKKQPHPLQVASRIKSFSRNMPTKHLKRENMRWNGIASVLFVYIPVSADSHSITM